MAAIVDARSGRVLPPPFHHGPGDSYFQVPWAFPMEPPLDYRLDSRLLIARICEKDKAISMGGRIVYQAEECGAHYFLISDGGLTLLSPVAGKVRNSLQEHQRQHHHHRHAHRQGLHVATIELGAMAEVSGHVKVEAQIQPPTDAAQAFILLHELAHLTGARTSPKRWW